MKNTKHLNTDEDVDESMVPINESLEKHKEDFFFKIKPKEEVIKIQDCAFINLSKKVLPYYFCSCSNHFFHPICEACAKTCHKDHNPTFVLKVPTPASAANATTKSQKK